MNQEEKTPKPKKENVIKLKYRSTFAFFLLMVLVAILNIISPCDGRDGNLFTIVYKKIMGTYVRNPYEKLPFVFSSSNITILEDSQIQFTYAANHPSKVVCITERSDIDGMTISYVESNENRFYFHSNNLYTPTIPIKVEIGETSRLYCKVIDLGVEKASDYLFTSEPFILRYSSLELIHSNFSDSYNQFEIIPKNFYIQTVNSTSPFESGEIDMVCNRQSLDHSPGSSDLELVISMRGFLPLHFEIQDESRLLRYEVLCNLYSVQYNKSIISQPLSIVIAPLSCELPVLFNVSFNKHL